MSLSVSFSTSQVIGNPSSIVITDSTSGSDVTAVGRRIAIVTSSGQYLTEDGLFDTPTYILWPLVDGSSITLELLDEDMALDISLQYLTVANAVVAEDTELQGFTLYAETFYYSLTQAQALQNQPPPMIIQDSGYYYQKMILRENIDDGNQAIIYGSDITTAQNAYSRATYQIQNQGILF